MTQHLLRHKFIFVQEESDPIGQTFGDGRPPQYWRIIVCGRRFPILIHKNAAGKGSA